jgi:hypothetical protein
VTRVRLWSVHPRYLDRAALVACWREGLLAQHVLVADDEGRVVGYRAHPQLLRLRAHDEPLALVGAYLAALADEADARGYRFDRTRVRRAARPDEVTPVPVTTGQLDLEWAHLRAKLAARAPDVAARWAAVDRPDPHPVLVVVPGSVADWERAPHPHDEPAHDEP